MSDARSRAEQERRKLELRMSAVGIQFAVSIIVGAAFGWWLDTRLGTDPWLMILGVVLGSVAAYRDLYELNRRVRELGEKGGAQ